MPLPIRWLLPCLALLAGTAAVPLEAAAPASPCGMLSKADIAKATGLTVGDGVAGVTIPGTLGRCTWTTAGHSRVILTLVDAPHMRITMEAERQTGATAIPGIGTAAVGSVAAPFTGGGYIVNVVDGKGGFGVSTLGPEGNRARAVALAKVVESRR